MGVVIYSLQISFSCITLPAILAAYSGQAAYLRKFPHTVSNIFYECIPGIIIFCLLLFSSYSLKVIYFSSLCLCRSLVSANICFCCCCFHHRKPSNNFS